MVIAYKDSQARINIIPIAVVMYWIMLHKNNKHHVEASAYLNLLISMTRTTNSYLRWSTDSVGVSLSWYIFCVSKYIFFVSKYIFFVLLNIVFILKYIFFVLKYIFFVLKYIFRFNKFFSF